MDQEGTPPTSEDQQPKAPIKQERFAHAHRNTGVFIYPEEETWAAHAKWVKAPELGIGFNTETYAYFDGKIAQKLGISALYNPKDKDYDKYEGLRSNIAVLRNFVLTHYERTGRFSHGSRREIPRIEAIAEALGQALKNDDALSRALTRSTSLDVARIDGVGASEMYKYLLEQQTRPDTTEATAAHFDKFKAMFTLSTTDWHLPDLEDSPFSPARLSAPPPGFKGMELPKPEDSSSTDTDKREQNKSDEDQAIDLCEQAVKTANGLYSIETLAEEPRETSIEEARKILRLLRNLEMTGEHLEEFLDHGTPATQLAKKEALVKLVDIFAQHYHQAVRRNPAMKSNPTLEQARDTASTIALELTEHTRRQLIAQLARERAENEKETQRTEALARKEQRVNQLIDSLSKQSELRIPQSAERLMDTLEFGIQQMAGQEVDTKNIDRLSKSSHQTHDAAMQLRDKSGMALPRRAESLTHARQMLGELRRIAPPQFTLRQFAETATLQQKIEFGKQVDELVEMYRNIMSEAMAYDPTLSSNPVITDANDAVGGFSSGVKLMAAKEIPNSLAAAQQISADITQEPSHWRQLHDRTIDRLIKSAEEGLEKAIAAVQEAEEGQAEEKGVQGVDNTALMQDNLRRKRRRGTIRWSGKGFRAQLKKLLDISADDRTLKQGRFRDDDDDSQQEGLDIAKAQAKRDQQRKANLDLQADDYTLKQGRFSQNEPEIQQEGKDVLKAQARKGEKQQLRQFLDTIADDRATGQGKFRAQDQQRNQEAQRKGQESQRRQEKQRNQQAQAQQREQQARNQSQVRQQNMINQQIKLSKLSRLSDKDRALIEELGGSLRNFNNQIGSDALKNMESTTAVKPDNRDMTQQTADRDNNRRNPNGPAKS